MNLRTVEHVPGPYCQATMCRPVGAPRPVRGRRFLCEPCCARLHEAVLGVAVDSEALEAWLEPLRTGDRVRGRQGYPLPIRVAVAELRKNMQRDMRRWCSYVMHIHNMTEQDNWWGRPPQDTRAMAAWLDRTADWLTGHYESVTLLDDMSEYRHAAKVLMDLPADRTRFAVGPCPEVVADVMADGHEEPIRTVVCAGNVWAHIPTDVNDPACLRCDQCGAEWEPRRWLNIGKRILTMIMEGRA